MLLSAATATAVESRLPDDVAFVPLGLFQLRGFPDPQPLFQLRHPDLRRCLLAFHVVSERNEHLGKCTPS